MPSFVRQTRPSRGLVAAIAGLALLGATASAAQSAGNGPPVCPAAFTAQTLEDALVRYAGAFTEEEIRAGFASHDLNLNGIVCGKPFQKDRFFPLQNLRDDHTGGP